MLLFHGTRLDRAGLRSLFAEGLRAHEHPWVHEVAAERDHAFLATAPVAGRGGDPMFFATAGRYRRGEGYILVVDVPRAALDDLVVGVFPNHALHQFLEARPIRQRPQYFLPGVIRLGHASDSERHAFAAQDPTLRGKYRDLHLEGVGYGTWCAYADAILAARTVAEVERAGRRHGVRWEEPEVVHCELCVQGMADWVFPLADGGALPASVAGRRVSADHWATLARRMAEWLAPHSAARVEEVLGQLPRGAAWGDLLRRLDVDEARLPEPWRPSFGSAWTEADLRQPDVQLACRALGPELLLGALRVTRGAQLAPWVRPAGGATMPEVLGRASRALRDRYRGRPVVYDGPD
ncbi:MAG: hypothetical protein CMN30_33740 [Sandaracinus sp.]|nr:hypothetical protein [Sandaracinus sp.]